MRVIQRPRRPPATRPMPSASADAGACSSAVASAKPSAEGQRAGLSEFAAMRIAVEAGRRSRPSPSPTGVGTWSANGREQADDDDRGDDHRLDEGQRQLRPAQRRSRRASCRRRPTAPARAHRPSEQRRPQADRDHGQDVVERRTADARSRPRTSRARPDRDGRRPAPTRQPRAASGAGECVSTWRVSFPMAVRIRSCAPRFGAAVGASARAGSTPGISPASPPAGPDAREKLPPQFGQTPPSTSSTQSAQKVHSKVQIIASRASGGRSLSQHSQLGRSSSMAAPSGSVRAR